jgi:hypothetical protein
MSFHLSRAPEACILHEFFESCRDGPWNRNRIEALHRCRMPVDTQNMRIGILGSGLMGGKLGTIFARAGHEVVSAMREANRS